MVRMLAAHGVRHVFGLCGDTSLPFYDALARLDHGITHLLARDERHAAYMADGYARVTGCVGVCEGPSGGGATYILPGVVEANESSVPVLAITTDVAATSAGRFPLTELDQQALFRPLTKWNAVLRDAAALPRMVRRAFREMTAGRPGAAHLSLPFDVQKAQVPEEEIWADVRFGRFPSLRAAPDPADVEEALSVLARARRPLVIAGGGVVLAGGEAALARLAEGLGIAVATTVSGQGSLAETHPLCIGVVGSNGGRPETRAVVEAADCVIFVGCRAGSVTTERWRAPVPGVSVIHIDADPGVIGASYRTEAAICADARLALEALAGAAGLPRFEGAEATAAAVWAAKRAHFRPLAASAERPIRPERVVATLERLLSEDAIICADPGTPCPYFSAYYPIRRGGRHLITNRAHGALGYALGAAIGAQVGRPGAKVVAAMGDGSFGMCAGELETLVRLRLPVTCVIFSNSTYGWIKAGQRAGFGGRFFSVDFSRTDHAAVATAYGVRSWRVEDPAELEAALGAAIAHDGPALVDIICQPLDEAAAPVSEWVA
jgi:acetolactate synthase-1/2/3 large subunit